MSRSSAHLFPRLALLAVCLGAIGPGMSVPGDLGAATDARVRMTIFDASVFPPVRVLNDGVATYTDFAWVPDGGDICVNATASSTGLAFIRLNRRQNWPDGDESRWCHERTEGQNLDGSTKDRTYTLGIDSVAACTEFGLTSPCQVTPDKVPQPHVRGESVFKTKAKATKVVFLLTKNGVDYRVETAVDAPMTGSANTKVVTYTGSAILARVGARSSIASFNLPFQMQFDRQ